MKVIVTSDALGDVVAGRVFYESRCPGLGDYFEQAVVLEVESLQFYAGTHPKRTGGFYRMLIRRFLTRFITQLLATRRMYGPFLIPGEIRFGQRVA